MIASTIFTTIPGGAAAGPNALTFDPAGNVYISDSFQGIIWQTAPTGGAATVWAQSPLLTTTGVPPFGANGLAFNRGHTAMFVANTGNDTVVKIPVARTPVRLVLSFPRTIPRSPSDPRDLGAQVNFRFVPAKR